MAKQKKEVPKRKHLIPSEYLWAVADRIHSTAPTKEIIFNTVRDVYCGAYSDGYLGRIGDSKYFKDKREASIKESFDSIKDAIDDEIHSKQQ